MPTYEYRCRTCDTTFELDRPMRESSAPANCPDGHKGAVRVLSAFAAVTSGGGGSAPAAACGMPASVAASAGCGGGCACH